MCRMIYVETRGYRPSAWRMVKFAMRVWGRTNDDGTGIAWQKGESIYTLKDKFPADRFFKAMDFSPKAAKILGHVRAGTNGSVTRENAHPFPSCTGHSVFMHNGIVTGFEELKKELIAKGHKFTSQTDSEIILHMAEEVGPAKVMEALKAKGVRGSANWVWFTPNETYAFSDGSLWLVEEQKGLQVGLFSDLTPFGKRFFRKAQELKQGTLVTIKNGKVVERKDIGTIPDTRLESEYALGYGFIRSYRGTGKYRTIYPYGPEMTGATSDVTNSGFVNAADDDEWLRMLREDDADAFEFEKQLSPKQRRADEALARAAGIRAGPPFDEDGLKERLTGEDNPFGLRRKPGPVPEITIGKGIEGDDAQYARAMQAFLRGKAREEREEKWRQQREIEESNDIERKLDEAGLRGLDALFDKEDRRRVWQEKLEEGATDGLDEVRPGDYYCRRCDQIVREPNLAGEEPRCRDCYGQLFLIDDMVNIKPGVADDADDSSAVSQ